MEVGRHKRGGEGIEVNVLPERLQMKTVKKKNHIGDDVNVRNDVKFLLTRYPND